MNAYVYDHHEIKLVLGDFIGFFLKQTIPLTQVCAANRGVSPASDHVIILVIVDTIELIK